MTNGLPKSLMIHPITVLAYNFLNLEMHRWSGYVTSIMRLDMIIKRHFVRVALVLVSMIVVGHAGAELNSDKPGHQVILLEGPVYNPHTKSYFELRGCTSGTCGFLWSEGDIVARSNVYNGVRGRMAIVRDQETHDFIDQHFKIQGIVWIGLRFICSARKLLWVDGEIHKLSAFKVWHNPWYRSEAQRCSSRPSQQYMSIHYTTEGGHLQWQAAGFDKLGNGVLIEYPTGKE